MLRRHNNEWLEADPRELSDIDQTMLTLMKADPDAVQRREILTSIWRIGCHRLHTHHRHAGTRNQRPQASPASAKNGAAAPSPGRPGQCSPGPLHARPFALRFNPDLKAKYQALKAAGKPAKVIILLRKLLILANALLKAQRKWPLKPLTETDTLAFQVRRAEIDQPRV